VQIYIVHYQNISNALSILRRYFAKKVTLQLMPKHVETQCWVVKSGQVVNCRSTGPRRQNTDNRKCSDNNVEWSTSADWRSHEFYYCTV